MNVKLARIGLPILNELAPLRRSGSRFFLVPAAIVAALLITVAGQLILGSAAALLFAFAVVFCAAFFGLLAGLFTALAATLTFDLFYLPPVWALNLDGHTLRVGVAFTALAMISHAAERWFSTEIRVKTRPLGIFGNLDGLRNGELWGWAFDADHPGEPVTVTILVDKHPAASVKAVYYRPDVAASMGCAGNHGFYVDLAEHFQNDREVSVYACLADGTPLAGSPLNIYAPAVPKRRERPTVLFLHIPKTAGTAFRDAIVPNFLESEIAYLYPGETGFPIPDLRALPLEQRRAFRLILGHYQFGVHEALPQQAEYVTIVREPAARVWSQYAYLRETQPDLMAGRDGQPMSLIEAFEKSVTLDLDNALVRYIGGVDGNIFRAGTLTADHCQQALTNIRTRFGLVGHQESSAASYRALQERYGWHESGALQPVNVGRLGSQSEPDPATAEAIRRFNHWDFVLYREILRLFPVT